MGRELSSISAWRRTLFYRILPDGTCSPQGSKLWRTVSWISFFFLLFMGAFFSVFAFIKQQQIPSNIVSLYGIIIGAIGAKAVAGEFTYNARNSNSFNQQQQEEDNLKG